VRLRHCGDNETSRDQPFSAISSLLDLPLTPL
jgi:hypothetical protein